MQWTTSLRRTNKSIIEEISLEAQIMKLHLSYFGHRVRRERSLEKDIMIEKLEGTSCRGRWIDTTTTTTGRVLEDLIRLAQNTIPCSILNKSPRLEPKLMGHDHNMYIDQPQN